MDTLPRAVLLDLDDTILDDSGSTSSCWLEACRVHKSELGIVDPITAYVSIERVREWYWADPERHRVGRLDLAAARREVAHLALKDVGVDDESLAGKIGDTYHEQRDALLRPFDEAIDTVEWLRASGCRLALLTNGSAQMQRSKIDRFDLAGRFDTILIEGEVGFGKPDPRIYKRALDVLGVAPRDTWMVGDNLEWDVAEPQRRMVSTASGSMCAAPDCRRATRYDRTESSASFPNCVNPMEMAVADQANAFVLQMREMARHMAWADATVWSVVLAAPQATGDSKIADTLHHIHQVQHIFLQAWTRAPFGVRERKEFATIEDIAAWGVEARRGVLSFVEQVSAAELAQEMRMPWAAFFEQQAKQPAAVHTMGESVLQVFLHTQHHRGQVCMRMREVGVAPPTIDFILWLWAGRPAETLSV